MVAVCGRRGRSGRADVAVRVGGEVGDRVGAGGEAREVVVRVEVQVVLEVGEVGVGELEGVGGAGAGELREAEGEEVVDDDEALLPVRPEDVVCGWEDSFTA